MTELLRARGLVVERRSREGSFILRVEDLSVRGGETLVVLGPNGAGKSTLLRALAGLDRPLRGSVERSARSRVTMVFQRPVAFAGTVEANAAVSLLGSGLPRAERQLRARRSLDRFGISPLATRRASTLSGGELRRLSLARAFVLEPDVLCLDEPFDDLDAAAQESLSRDLRQAVRELGIGLVVVTHDLRRALLLADRIAILICGSLEQLADRDVVLGQPASVEVARLVGMANLLAGEVAAADPSGSEVRFDRGASLRVAGEIPPGSRVVVGIRPEHVKLDRARGGDAIVGEGVVRELLADGLIVSLRIRWDGNELVTHLISGRGLARTLAVGDRVRFSVRPEDVRIFPSFSRDGE